MAPHLQCKAALFQSLNDQDNHKNRNNVKSQDLSAVRASRKLNIVWRNVLGFLVLHLAAVYGLYLTIAVAKWATVISIPIVAFLGGMGITAGAHRLWAHRTYKANWKLRTLLCFLQTIAFQNHVYEWVRDHRVHHKFTDTDADPHNSERGFFFSHIGWLMTRKHKDVIVKGATVDMSDLQADPVVMFQKKYYLILVPLCCFAVPTFVPYYFWDETAYVAFYVAVLRYIISLNATWSVNSAAHIWGTKPYDKSLSPTSNLGVAMITFGEGWHNYHHVFPWDYKAAELGNYRANTTTAFIDFFARIGWAYDLKTTTVEMVQKRVLRTGDGSHPVYNGDIDGQHSRHDNGKQIWGWDDKDMSLEDRQDAEILNKK